MAPEGGNGSGGINLGPVPVVAPVPPQPILAPEGDEAPEGVAFDLDPDPVEEPDLPPPPEPNPQVVTRSGRVVRRPTRLIETMLTHHRCHPCIRPTPT